LNKYEKSAPSNVSSKCVVADSCIMTQGDYFEVTSMVRHVNVVIIEEFFFPENFRKWLLQEVS